MFLYLMDGCDDWWKEIMQKGPLLVSSFAMEKEKESKAVALPLTRIETSRLQEDAQQI